MTRSRKSGSVDDEQNRLVLSLDGLGWWSWQR